MIEALKDLSASKKFLATLLAILVYGGGHVLGVPAETTDRIWAALLAYVLAQGVADLGKGAAQARTALSSAAFTVASGTTPGTPAQTGKAGVVVGAFVAACLLAGVATQHACAGTGHRVATGASAGLDCELSQFNAQDWQDAKTFAQQWFDHWTLGTEKPSADALVADLQRLQGSLSKCAVVAVVAAAGDTTTSLAPASASVREFKATFRVAAIRLGWTPAATQGPQ